MRNFGTKNMGDNVGKVVYRNYPTARFHLHHGSATWARNIVMYRGSSVPVKASAKGARGLVQKCGKNTHSNCTIVHMLCCIQSWNYWSLPLES